MTPDRITFRLEEADQTNLAAIVGAMTNGTLQAQVRLSDVVRAALRIAAGIDSNRHRREHLTMNATNDNAAEAAKALCAEAVRRNITVTLADNSKRAVQFRGLLIQIAIDTKRWLEGGIKIGGTQYRLGHRLPSSLSCVDHPGRTAEAVCIDGSGTHAALAGAGVGHRRRSGRWARARASRGLSCPRTDGMKRVSVLSTKKATDRTRSEPRADFALTLRTLR